MVIESVGQTAHQLRKATESLADHCQVTAEAVTTLQEAATDALTVTRTDTEQLLKLLPLPEFSAAVTGLSSAVETIAQVAESQRKTWASALGFLTKEHRHFSWGWKQALRWLWPFGRSGKRQ